MKLAIVQKPFPYAHDGINVRDLTKGETFECQDDVFDGLVKDGYIKPTKEQNASDAKAKADADAAAKAEADAKAKADADALAVIEAEAKIRAIPIPEKWMEAPEADKIALAGDIVGTAPADAAQATDIITAELAKRAG